MVRSLTPSGVYAVADYAAGARKNVSPANTPDDRTAQVRNPNAPQAAEVGLQSGVLYYTGYYRYFFGTGTPTTSAQVRALSGSQLTNQGSVFILNTGTSATSFSFWLPQGKTPSNVTDLDNLNANITGAYIGTSLSVADAGGTLVPGTRYTLTAQAPYSANARHQVTVS